MQQSDKPLVVDSQPFGQPYKTLANILKKLGVLRRNLNNNRPRWHRKTNRLHREHNR